LGTPIGHATSSGKVGALTLPAAIVAGVAVVAALAIGGWAGFWRGYYRGYDQGYDAGYFNSNVPEEEG